jgi:Flp pilus assembly protein TadD
MDEDRTGSSHPESHEAVDRLLRDPLVRAQVVEVLLEELSAARTPSRWKRVQPWLAGAASAMVTVLAFFLPSLQEQWDRWQSRRVIQSYVGLGRSFLDEGRFRLAEEAFGKAFELSENRRLDIEEMRLEARIGRLDAEPSWGGPNPKGLNESDLLYLIHLREGRRKPQADAWRSYAAFLSGEGRFEEADVALGRAAALDSTDAATWIGVGNVAGDRGRTDEAVLAYRHAIRCSPEEPSAHYDLALLLAQQGDRAGAETELRRTLALAPDDRDALEALAQQLDARGERSGADSMRTRAAKLPRAPRTRDVAPAPADAQSD